MTTRHFADVHCAVACAQSDAHKKKGVSYGSELHTPPHTHTPHTRAHTTYWLLECSHCCRIVTEPAERQRERFSVCALCVEKICENFKKNSTKWSHDGLIFSAFIKHLKNNWSVHSWWDVYDQKLHSWQRLYQLSNSTLVLLSSKPASTQTYYKNSPKLLQPTTGPGLCTALSRRANWESPVLICMSLDWWDTGGPREPSITKIPQWTEKKPVQLELL